jgi:hypothetical protein
MAADRRGAGGPRNAIGSAGVVRRRAQGIALLFPEESTMLRWVLLLALAAAAPTVRAGPAPKAVDPCSTFNWDVRHERALFAGQARSLAAGKAAADAPAVAPDRLYELQLRKLAAVTFAVPPAHRHPLPAGYAGVVTLKVDAAGMYRVALNQAFWIDVVADGAPIRSSDFEGRSACAAPHKIVEFMLPANTPLTLQFSSGTTPTLRLTVSRAPAARAR